MDNLRRLARLSGTVFSTARYREVLREGNSGALEAALAEVRSLSGDGVVESRRQAVRQAWVWLLEHRRDDAALRGLFLSRSRNNPLRPTGNDFAFELRLGNALVDFAFLAPGNEEGVEIKSKYDAASRVSAQLTEYRRVLPRVSLVGDARDASRMRSIAAAHGAGLLLVSGLGRDWQLERDIEAPVITATLDPAAIISALRVDEVRAVAQTLLGEEVSTSRANLYPAAVTALRSHDVETVMRVALAQVSARRQLSARELIRTVPAPLRSIVATIDPSRSSVSELNDWLDVEA